MKTSRQQVLEYVTAQRLVSARDISRAMQMTDANARHHLNILVEQGVVAVVGQRSKQGKGRPVQMYGLSEQAAGHNLDRLAGSLLDELLDGQTREQQEQTLERLAGRMLKTVQPADGEQQLQRSHLTRRLFQAVRQLNEFNYDARWEAHTLAPRLILGRCPYAAIAGRRPQICRLDHFLLQQLVEAPVEQIALRQADRSGVKQCIFVVG